ncbi:MAG: DUF3106 domain-containing protein [Deltaproteobacteria bacterium]|nr:MAG: DUF3106 domain-containing protein [Deltaproteobacteria bacterium]
MSTSHPLDGDGPGRRASGTSPPRARWPRGALPGLSSRDGDHRRGAPGRRRPGDVVRGPGAPGAGDLPPRPPAGGRRGGTGGHACVVDASPPSRVGIRNRGRGDRRRGADARVGRPAARASSGRRRAARGRAGSDEGQAAARREPRAGRPAGDGDRSRGAAAGACCRAGALHGPPTPPEHGEARALRDHSHDHAGRRGGAIERMKRLGIVALLTAVLAAPVVRAQQPRPWHQLSPDEQRRAWENYRRYQQLPEHKQRSLEERYQRFQAMPPQDRDRLRQNYETYRGFDPGQRQEFGQKYRRWKSGQH